MMTVHVKPNDSMQYILPLNILNASFCVSHEDNTHTVCLSTHSIVDSPSGYRQRDLFQKELILFEHIFHVLKQPKIITDESTYIL